MDGVWYVVCVDVAHVLCHFSPPPPLMNMLNGAANHFGIALGESCELLDLWSAFSNELSIL